MLKPSKQNRSAFSILSLGLQQRGSVVTYLPVTSDGLINLNELEDAIAH